MNPDDYASCTTLMIREEHLDTFGHVNNATFLTLYEGARWDWVTRNGYGLQTVREKQVGPTILEVNVKFMKELRLREEIRIYSRLLSYERKIGQLEQLIVRGEENTICSKALFTIGLFDLKQRSLIVPSAEWLSALS